MVFNHKSPNPNICMLIKMQAIEFFLCINSPKCNHQMITKLIKWETPELGWLKLNADGSFDDLLGNARGGGLIRDEQGQRVAGFTRKIGKTNSFMAKAWALRDGLVLCNQMKVSKVIVESDTKVVVDALNNRGSHNSAISPLFDDYRQLASNIPQVVFRQIYCEANSCADRLANLGHLQQLDFVLHSSPPVDLASFVLADC